jgi:CheY-like chemotaxis protein
MDCNMPHLDGYDASDRIRQYFFDRNLTQPIIVAITGHTEQIFVNKAIKSGINQVLSKPVDA